MTNYLGNAFSLQMINLEESRNLRVDKVDPEEIPNEVVSCIGHADTAKVVSEILGREIAMNRISVHLDDGDVLYVAQITGGRLPEGTTSLPEGFSITFLKVNVE